VNADRHIIEYDKVSKVFRRKKEEVTALKDVSFAVTEGELFVIVGPSGCGKSTLLRMAGGLTFPTGGEVRLKNRKVIGPNPELGFVFQSPNLLPWRSVIQNVLLPVEFRRQQPEKFLKKAQDLLSMVGLGGFESKYPFELSGGMQHRAAMARALITDPAVVLMDEPFGALDALTRDALNFELMRVWERLKNTIVLVTHSIEEAVLLADRVIVMTARPGTIAKTLDISMPRPRKKETKFTQAFESYVSDIESVLGL
jgi:NitT/TauT family transport system ATP-binding protein